MTSQVAITLLKNLEQSLDSYCELNDEGKTAFDMAITALEQFGNSEQLHTVNSLPSMQLEKTDIVEIMEQLRNAKVTILPSAEPLVLTCDGCRHVGTYDTDFPCSGCIRREKDYYEQER